MLKLLVVLVLVSGALAAAKQSLRADSISVKGLGNNGKIVNGIDATVGQFPYMASLRFPYGGNHYCGSTIVAPEWVLTAAHCCDAGVALEVYAGSIYLDGDGQTQSIKEFIVHPEYNPDNYWINDICLVRLSSPLQLNSNTDLVRLPQQGLLVPGGASTVISGWGFTSDGNAPNCLQVLYNDTTITNEECTYATRIEIAPQQLCTLAGPGYATCPGDSGSPLMLNGTLVGLTSWGFMPCGSGKPDVFTRVPEYVDWIESTIGAVDKQLKFQK